MRRFTVAAVVAFVILAMLAPPGFAQAPAPKVTLSGLFDQVTSMGRNTYDGNLTRNSDSEWYARTRFRPDFEFAVGRVRAVLGIEIDLMYGQAGPNDGGFPGNVSGQAGGVAGGTKVNTNGALDLNTDVGGMMEMKWLYTEFPLTGKDSLLPFIPIVTMARAGAQPFDTLGQYKLAQYANGDFAGISAVTTITPQVKSNLAWAILEDQLAGANRGQPSAKTGRGEDYALIASVDVTPTKGLDLKPLYSWFHADGVTATAARRPLTNVLSNGGQFSAAAARSNPVGGVPAGGSPDYHEDRHTLGADARWRLGGFGLDPTFYYQFGHYETQAIDNSTGGGGIRKFKGDINAAHFDIIASYQLGPVLLEGRGVYSTGNKARDNLAKGVNYYQPLDTDGNYWAGGWTQFWASGIDYFNQGWAQTGAYVGYDRYGRGGVAGRVTYNFTPAVSLYGVAHLLLTAQAVDTDTGTQLASGTAQARTANNVNSFVKGDSNYVGTEFNLGLTWRFSANTAFDLVTGYLFAGEALDATEVVSGNAIKKEAQDAYTLAARIRLAF